MAGPNNKPLPSGSPDLSVSLSMLIYEHRVRIGTAERHDTYEGIPEDFNWDEFSKDYAKLTK